MASPLPPKLPEDLSRLPEVDITAETGVSAIGYDKDNPPRMVRFKVPGSADSDPLALADLSNLTLTPAALRTLAGAAAADLSNPEAQAALLDQLPPFTVIFRDAPATNVIETGSSIAENAFYYGINVTAVLGGNNVLTVEPQAFRQSSVQSVSLPAATSIGVTAFNNCSALTSISLPAATAIGDSAFANCSALTTVSLPAATSIGNQAFFYCSALTSISLPAATSIGGSAFSYCSALASVSLPAATSIGGDAFQSCTALASVSLPAATSIGTSAFGNCTALASVSLPAATSIGIEAFGNCTALASVSLPAATSIGIEAFGNCTFLTSGVYLNAPLAGLDADALTGSSITTIHLRPAPNTPAGWVAGAGQTIKGKSGITVVFDWTTWPNLPA